MLAVCLLVIQSANDNQGQDQGSGSSSLPPRHTAFTNNSRKALKTKALVKKVPWTSKEKSAVNRFFVKHIRLHQVPGKAACVAAKAAEPDLINRSWQNIKFCVKNLFASVKS